ncbi:MAG: LPS biosynthesis protein WbpP, partial [Candidatus Thorarchaeota archaeon]
HINQTYNIGTGEEISIESALQTIASVLDMEVEYETRPPRLQDPPRMVFNIDKAKKYLKYNPKYNFRQGMEELREVWK